MQDYLIKVDIQVGEVEYKQGDVVSLEETDGAPLVAEGKAEVMVS